MSSASAPSTDAPVDSAGEAPAWLCTASEVASQLEELEREDDEEVLATPRRPRSAASERPRSAASERLHGGQPSSLTGQSNTSQHSSPRQPRRPPQAMEPAPTPRSRAPAPRVQQYDPASCSKGVTKEVTKGASPRRSPGGEGDKPAAPVHAQRKAALSPEVHGRCGSWQPPARASGVLSAERWPDSTAGSGGRGCGGGDIRSRDATSDATRPLDRRQDRRLDRHGDMIREIMEMKTRTAHKSFAPARSLSPTRIMPTSARLPGRSFPAGFRPAPYGQPYGQPSLSAREPGRWLVKMAHFEGSGADETLGAMHAAPRLSGGGGRPALAPGLQPHGTALHEGGAMGGGMGGGGDPHATLEFAVGPLDPGPDPGTAGGGACGHEQQQQQQQQQQQLLLSPARELRHIPVARAAIQQLNSERPVLIARPSTRPESARAVLSRHERPPPPHIAPTRAQGRAGGRGESMQRRAPRLIALETRASRVVRRVHLGTATTTIHGQLLGIFSAGPGTYVGDVLHGAPATAAAF